MKCYFVRNARMHELNAEVMLPNMTVVLDFMVHGEACRPADENSRLPWLLGDPPHPPLHIIRNVYGMPKVFRPILEFVVAEEIAQRLASPNLQYRPVVFEKLFNVPWSFGDAKVARRFAPSYDPLRFARKVAPLEEEEWKRVGTYYEMVNPVCDADLAAGYDNLQVITAATDADIFSHYVEPFSAQISSAMLRDCPVMYHLDGVHILSEAAWDVMGPELQNRYYRVAVAEVK